jgi:SAM-dependent methyltransferase
VLAEWLPPSGLVLEIASGTGEHSVFFAERFPGMDWQPSDVHPDALASIIAWRDEAKLPNLRPPLKIDASSRDWPVDSAEAVLSIKMDSDSCDHQKTAETGGFDVVLNLNMVHISPWGAALGLLDGAARVLKRNGALILYGPWLQAGVETAPSNLAFDQQLRERDPEWGLRRVEDFDAAASKRGFRLEQTRAMPANNLMLLFRLAD